MKLDILKELAKRVAATGGETDHKKMYEAMATLGLDPNTFYQELEMTSPYVDTHRDTSYSNAHLQLHSHNFFELIYCCNSCGAEYLVGSERYRLIQGDLLFVPPGVSHRPLLPENLAEPYNRYVIWLSTKFMEQYAQLFPYSFTEKQSYTNLLRTKGTKWEQLGNDFFIGVQESEQKADGWEAFVIGNTISLLTKIKRATDDRNAHTLKAEKPELLDQIMVYVEQNYSKNISLNEIAKEFFISSSTVSHLFKQKLDISFYRFVTQRRLIAAKSLIADGIPLETTATEVGFKDYSSFYRSFKQEYGISPRQYKNIL